MSSTANWIRTKNCPICGKDRCTISPDGGAAHCFRKGLTVQLGDQQRKDYVPQPIPKDDIEPVKKRTGSRVRRVDEEAEMLDTAYRAFLETLTISEAHEHYLWERRLTKDEVEELGIKTLPGDADKRSEIARRVIKAVDRPNMMKVPGINAKKCTVAAPPGDILVIPIYDAYHRIVALRYTFSYDDKRRERKKYLWASGYGGPRLPLGARLLVARPSNPRTDRVWITEGEIKANVIAERMGAIAISLPGVSPPGEEQIKELVETIPLCERPKEVVIALDKDAEKNERVKNGKWQIIRACRNAGYVVYDTSWEGFSKGVDDAIICGEEINVELAQYAPERKPGSPWRKSEDEDTIVTHVFDRAFENDPRKDDAPEDDDDGSVEKKSLEYQLKGGQKYSEWLTTKSRWKRKVGLLPRANEPEDRYACLIAGCMSTEFFGRCQTSRKIVGKVYTHPCRLFECPFCRRNEAFMIDYSLGRENSPYEWPQNVVVAHWPWKVMRDEEEAECAILWENDESEKPKMYKQIRKHGIRRGLITIMPTGEFEGYNVFFRADEEGIEQKLKNAGFQSVRVESRSNALSFYKESIMGFADIFSDEVDKIDEYDQTEEELKDQLETIRARWPYAEENRRHKTIRPMRGALPTGISDEQRKYARDQRMKDKIEDMKKKGIEPKDKDNERCEDHKDEEMPCSVEYVVYHTETRAVIQIQDTKHTRKEAQSIIAKRIPLLINIPPPPRRDPYDTS